MTTTVAVAPRQSNSYKWYVLTLAALTFTCVMAIPNMSLSVLFEEISTDLQLNLVQVGWIWGIGSVMGIVVGLIGGPIGDRIGPKRVLTWACLLVGITGAARGLAWNFASLAVFMFFMGFAQWAIPMNVHKTCGVWFSGPRLGMANGIVSVGMAFGFMLGSLLAATVFSPLLGGWRAVFVVYGGVALLFSLLWALSAEKQRDVDESEHAGHGGPSTISLAAALRHVARIPNVWLLSFATLGVASCVQGMLGYLPLYLREMGWVEATADGALASFHAVSMVAAIPITILSDRLGSRKLILMTAALFVATGTGLLSVVSGAWIWLAVIVAGLVRDGYMATTMTAMMEVKGVGTRYAGSATGLLLACLGLGSAIAPPLGNRLAHYGASMPFLFWAGLAVMGFCCYLLVRQRTS